MGSELFRMQSMQNLSSIGHGGNVSESSGSSGSSSGRDIYGGMFEGGGKNIVDDLNEFLNNSFTAKFMTLGAVNIFDAVKAGPVPFGNLESLSLMNFLDIGKTLTGFSLPLPLSLPSKNKGRGK